MTSDTLAMAASARDKLQGVWSSMFRSTEQMEEDSDKSEQRKLTPRSFTSFENAMGTGAALESMMKTMFGSCTSGNVGDTEIGAASSSRSSSSREVSNEHKEEEDYRYYVDPHSRAAHVVDSLRMHKEQRLKRTQSSKSTPGEATALPKPFPISAPHQRSKSVPEAPPLVHEVIPTNSVAPSDPAADGHFDDGISAISAFTLEEMVRQDELHRLTRLNRKIPSDLTQESFDNLMENNVSGESPLFAKSVNKSGEHADANRVPLNKLTNALSMSRGRSNGTFTSKGTKSTKSTEFAEQWKMDEQNYWENQVEEDKKSSVASSPQRQAQALRQARAMRTRSRSRSSDMKVRQNGTFTTASSSVHSGALSSPFSTKHPHDTLQIDATDLFPSNETLEANRCIQVTRISAIPVDPDRIVTDETLMLDHVTEIGEI